MGYVVTIERYTSLYRLFKTGERHHKLSLTVTLNSRETDDFAFSYVERHVFYGVVLMHLRCDR